MLLVLLTFGALSDPVLIDSVVQRWLLATDCDCIAVVLSFESSSMRKKELKFLSLWLIVS